jgi:predicted metal-dependent enzyme (double-stranded beta helix superfamily)
MCDLSHHHDHEPGQYGYIVDVPEIRALIDETRRLMREVPDHSAKVEALKPAFSRLLAADGWLPEAFAQPDTKSGMGGGIGQYALYRDEAGELCLFTLVVPPGAATPVHDHLAWGIIGVYRGEQLDTTYARLDDGSEEGKATLQMVSEQVAPTGSFYTLLPPDGDIHYVKTLSEAPSVSIHLLANDTACVWRHRFDPAAGTVTPFRSGYSNAACPPEAQSTR